MAEITKITQPMIPRENMGTKFKPETDQAFALNDPGKVFRRQESNPAGDKKTEQSLREQISRDAILPALRPTADLTQALRKLLFFVEMGVSSSGVMLDNEIRALLESLFVSPEQLLRTLTEQDKSSVLFKGQSFDILRDVAGRFTMHPQVKDALVQVLKTFEYNVNVEQSIKSILQNCDNILDYMFSADREQFAHYLAGLKAILLPAEEKGGLAAPAEREVSQKEAAQLLKNNLVPLLGEVVGKYHQAPKIRDIVMVIIHNVVRVDKGTPEDLEEAAARLASELKKVANLPPNFEKLLLESLKADEQKARLAPDRAAQKMTDAIVSVFRDGGKASTVRQAENLLVSLLQNQSPVMNVLHFVLPLRMGVDRSVAEVYVDPDSDERESRSGSSTRKIFLSAESEELGSFELCFWVVDKRIDFSLWCPGILIDSLARLRGTFSEIMMREGYSIGQYQVQEFTEPQSVAQVFPKLVTRRTGIDVRI